MAGRINSELAPFQPASELQLHLSPQVPHIHQLVLDLFNRNWLFACLSELLSNFVKVDVNKARNIVWWFCRCPCQELVIPVRPFDSPHDVSFLLPFGDLLKCSIPFCILCSRTFVAGGVCFCDLFYAGIARFGHFNGPLSPQKWRRCHEFLAFIRFACCLALLLVVDPVDDTRVVIDLRYSVEVINRVAH